jgi:Tol biopolymer transport system component/uncharacterized caspase-like protein
VAPRRRGLLVATYDYQDPGLRRLAAPAHDAQALAEVLRNPDIAGFDITVLLNEPHYVVGEAIGRFYAECAHEDLALLYFSGHGLKDDEGLLYLAMTNTRHDQLLFTGLPAAQVSAAMDRSASKRKVLILDCCYSGAFPAGHTSKGDPAVHTLDRFEGKGRAVLTASDATQYSFEGDEVVGEGSQSVFTRYLVEAIRSGEADQDADGDIALDELYAWVYDHVVAEMPQQRPKKKEEVDGRIVIARNINWELPAHLRNAIASPMADQRQTALPGLADLHRRGNEVVRARVEREVAALVNDDSRTVSEMAAAVLAGLGAGRPRPELASPATPPQPVTLPPSVPRDPATPPPVAEPEESVLPPPVAPPPPDTSPPPAGPVIEPEPMPPVTEPIPLPTPPWWKRHRGQLTAGAAGLVVAAALVGRLVTSSGDSDSTSIPAASTSTGTTPPPGPVPGLPSAQPLSTDTMVFSRTVEGNADLYLVDVAADAVGQRLTTGPEPDFTPLISPDRGSIVYFHAAVPGRNDLWVMASDGSGARPLFADVPDECAGLNYQPAWDPVEPTVLALSCGNADGDRSLWLVSVEGELIRQLDTPLEIADDLTFSADGSTLAFWSGPDRDAQGGSIWTVATVGGQSPVRLTDQAAGVDADPAWSPDGKQIAFRRVVDGDPEIFVMDPDGSRERPLFEADGSGSDPTWSPDGSRIAFVSNRDLGDAAHWHAWVMNADGSSPAPLLVGEPGDLLFSQAWSRR